MAGSWTSFDAPDTSTGAFKADMMLLLTDGTVLIHNASATSGDLEDAKQWLRMSPDHLGDYSNPTWSSEIDMINARQFFASGILPDGRVFAIGGEYSDDPAFTAGQNDTPLGEIFDPTTNTWSQITKPSSFTFVRGDASSCVLPDGRVLIGGASTSGGSATWSKRTALWDANDNSWVEAGLEFGAQSSTTKNDGTEEEGFTLLQDGTVMAVEVASAPSCEKYLPAQDQWVPASSTPNTLVFQTLLGASVFEVGPTVTLPNGKVLAIGATGNTALYTPPSDPSQPGSWAAGPTFPSDTSGNTNWTTLTAIDAPACVMPSGRVIMVGGSAVPLSGDFFSQGITFLEMDPASSATTIPSLDVQPSGFSSSVFTYQCWFILLPTGQLLVSNQAKTLFLYTPDAATSAPNAAWKPGNISVPTAMVQGHSYTVTGTQLNGLTQAVAYGDDGAMATNYPIVRLTNPATHEVRYLRSYNFSTMGIATGTNVPADLQSCAIDIPGNLPPGNWDLQVIANGIASNNVLVQVAAQDCFIVLENSTFSVGEIDTYVHAMPPVNAVFNPAFYVVVEGFTPAEMGFSSPADLASPPFVPTVPSPFGAMQIAFAGPVVAQDPTLPPTPQRFTFPFTITFTDDSMFGASAFPVNLTAIFSASGSTVFSTATITLTPNPNPYILHGDLSGTPPEPWYLSQDIRVFQLVASAGNSKLGASIATSGSATTAAINYIRAAVTNLRNNVGSTRAEFDNIAQDEDTEVLQLLPNDPGSGNPVYNFAIARVRLRDTMNASNVRAFFRLWQAQQTNAAYQSTAYARATNGIGQPIPVLGVQGDEIITIPFFAQERVTTSQQLSVQQDEFNRHDIDASAGETDFFFGVWLDINQPGDLRYPQRIVSVSPNGPFNTVTPLFPIQQFMVAAHQCLIVEIAYDLDPIPPNADPSNNDKLAQRNLTFVGAPNPGHPDSRRVPQTFEVKPTHPSLPSGVKPDELMINWGAVPAGSFAEVYMPAVSADGVLAMAATLYTAHQLERVDAHTLRFPAAGVTYIPIPPGVGVTFAGLLTLDLPMGIHKGEVYTAVVRQLTSVVVGGVIDQGDQGINEVGLQTNFSRKGRQWRRTTGSFKLTIPVSTKAELLEPEERYLAVMKWVAEAIPTTSRWYLIMKRYLDQIGGRVTQMGGDPTTIMPSGTGGIKPKQPHPGKDECLRLIGKIESIIYDRFGDFEGFTLETERGEYKVFESREPRIGDLVRRAWQERFRLLVIADYHHPHRPTSIVFLV